MKCFHHGLLVHPQKLAIRHCRSRAHAQKLACQCSLTEKVSLIHDPDGRFLARGRYNSELYFAFLDVEDSIRLIPLSKYRLFFRSGHDLSASADRGKKSVWVELTLFIIPSRGRFFHKATL